MKTDASMQHRVMCHKHEYADARSNSIRRSNRVHDAFQCGRSNVRLDAGDLTLREREMLQTCLNTMRSAPCSHVIKDKRESWCWVTRIVYKGMCDDVTARWSTSPSRSPGRMCAMETIVVYFMHGGCATTTLSFSLCFLQVLYPQMRRILIISWALFRRALFTSIMP